MTLRGGRRGASFRHRHNGARSGNNDPKGSGSAVLHAQVSAPPQAKHKEINSVFLDMQQNLLGWIPSTHETMGLCYLLRTLLEVGLRSFVEVLFDVPHQLGAINLPGVHYIEHVELSPERLGECNSNRCSVSGLPRTVRSIENPLDLKSAGLENIDLRADGESGAA